MAAIQKLSNELLKDILDHIESDPQRSIAIDRRDHLSVESFGAPSPPPPSQAHDIASFRLSCRRFSELGASYQFARISLRFSSSGFHRLDNICSSDHLSKHTKKFSYLVPPFYGSRLRSNGESDAHTIDAVRHADVVFSSKIKDQQNILQTGEDVRILRKAMASFTALQHVQILRLIEPITVVAQPLVDIYWSLTCSHVTKTVGEALMHAHSPFSRFSGPMMNPHSVLVVQRKIPQTLSLLASRLTCLELHFDGGPELRERMTELSSLARAVFLAAKNLHALHVGFPSRTPLDIRLEAIFHDVHWERLRAFGIQAWRLDANEIIKLARRHSKTLRGLRLRDVQLKEGSVWKEVLSMLRTEMEQLDWVSLRRIDYENHFDEVWADSMEVPDDPLAGASDSDNETDFPAHLSDQDSDSESNGVETDDVESSGEDSDEESHASTDHGPDGDELALSPDTPRSLPFCTCSRNSYPASADDLGDNGLSVTYQQRKMWEKWVVGQCPEHSPT